jgi:hypothetical protein
MTSTTSRIIGIALATFALAAPAAVAKPIQDSGESRSSSLAGTTTPRQDLRSADTRDAAAGRGTFNAPHVTVVRMPTPAPVGANGGFDWGDAGIGAASLLGMIALGLGGAMAIGHRRRRGTQAATAG